MSGYRQITLELDEIARLKARVAELERLLEPWAEYARIVSAIDDLAAAPLPDDIPFGLHPERRNWEGAPTLGDARRCLAAMACGTSYRGVGPEDRERPKEETG
jgi:hypothetical protein